VVLEVSIAILNHIADWHLVLLNNCGHWPPFYPHRRYLAAKVRAFVDIGVDSLAHERRWRERAAG
jgi:hypothetical protein